MDLTKIENLVKRMGGVIIEEMNSLEASMDALQYRIDEVREDPEGDMEEILELQSQIDSIKIEWDYLDGIDPNTLFQK